MHVHLVFELRPIFVDLVDSMGLTLKSVVCVGRVLWALLSITVGAYISTAVIAGLLFFFFDPAGAGDCSFNISIISLTLALGLLISAVSMSPYVRCPDP